MEQLVLKAYAKVNLGLDVLHKRTDGYHEVRMIMQTLELHDVITLKKTANAGIYMKTDSDEIEADESNLAWKAAALILEEFPQEMGISIELEKRIPVAAGMAGGSTDAAAVLRGLNKLFDLQLDTAGLMERAVRLGADVPYCVVGGTMLAEGIGEKLSRLESVPDCHVLLVKPDIAVSTKWVYENLRLNEQTQHPDIDAQIKGLCEHDLAEVTENMGNVLESVTEAGYPVIRELKSLLQCEHAAGVLMSGSGPTVFGIFDEESCMEAAAEKIKGRSDVSLVYKTHFTDSYETE